MRCRLIGGCIWQQALGNAQQRIACLLQLSIKAALHVKQSTDGLHVMQSQVAHSYWRC